MLPLHMRHIEKRQQETQEQQEHASDGPELQGPKLKGKRWTWGNSNALVEGAEPESPWVAAGWILVPLGLALLILAGMITYLG